MNGSKVTRSFRIGAERHRVYSADSLKKASLLTEHLTGMLSINARGWWFMSSDAFNCGDFAMRSALQLVGKVVGNHLGSEISTGLLKRHCD
jgi:hypothetical protein